MLWTSRRRTALSAPPVLPPSSEAAWKILTLVNDWIRHAETKAAAALASSGATGALLYTLVKDNRPLVLGVGIGSGVCALLIFAASGAAAMALRPRLGGPGSPTSLLYYGSIARTYPIGVDAYRTALTALLSDPPALVAAIADQAWVNARIAYRKYRWTNLSISTLLLALLALAVTAIIAGVT